MKKGIALLSLFLFMLLAGAGTSLLLVSEAHACTDCAPSCDGTCTPYPLGPREATSGCEDGCCQAPTPYVLLECNGYCSAGGPCDCVKIGCYGL